MIDALWFLWAAACALALAHLPGIALSRALGIGWRTAAAVAPALTAAVFGSGAVVANLVGQRWNLLSALATTVLAGLALRGIRLLLERLHSRLRTRRGTEDAAPPEPGEPPAPLLVPRWTSAAVLLPALALAVVPIMASFSSPGQPLQRWDALFHLNALQTVRDTGYGSTLNFASISTTDDSGGIYPAAFHDIVSLVPLASTPIVLNAATLVLALVPWVYGMMYLARMLWPRVTWAPLAAGTAAAIAPAIPLSEWIHLAAIPNLVAFAFLPGVLGTLVAGFRALRFRFAGHHGSTVSSLVIAAAIGAVGLGLTHPNVFLALCLLVAAAALGGTVEQWRRRPRLARFSALTAVLATGAVAAVAMMPASGAAGDFVGGLAISPVRAIGELALGLLTVWPMATGPLLWLTAYIGLWALLRRGSVLLPLVLTVPVILYIDAAIDSPLRLSALWYSGQDRISMLVTLVVCLLVVPGLAHLQRHQRKVDGPTRRIVQVLGLLTCILVAMSTIGPRLDYAERNLDLDRPDRARYFDAEEYAMLQEVGGTMDTEKVLLTSPFSGGAHLYGMTGQSVRFPAAGMNPTEDDDQLMDDVLAAPDDPAACRRLQEANIGYVYADRRPYNVGGSFVRLDQAEAALGTVIGSTDHSMMIEIDCDAE
jgi:hypothetical protein